MIARSAGALALGFAAAAAAPHPAAARLDLQLGPHGLQDSDGTTITVGTVGMDSHAGGSYRPAKGDDPYYFIIPSERPAQGAPGFLVHIPLGNDQSH